jgi:phosphoglycolate phosphatase-like HAD superfamily hydrolase
VDVATARAAGVPMVGVQADAATARAMLAAGAMAVLPTLGGLPGWLVEHGTGWV